MNLGYRRYEYSGNREMPCAQGMGCRASLASAAPLLSAVGASQCR